MTSPISSTAGKPSITLAIETSGTKGSLALGADAAKQVAWEKKAIHSEMATVKLQELLQSNGLEVRDVSRVIVNSGPGSFTGIRVGLNLARALGYSLNIPVMTFNTLELLAAKNAEAGETVFVAIKAIQNFYYCAGFTLGLTGPDQSLAPCSLTFDELNQAAKPYAKVLIEGQSTAFSPDLEATDMFATLARWSGRQAFLNWKEAKPVYIRASEAEEKLLKGLLKT
jgi:tRNA threonylcarbamoyladenosine biosynthesis protein TsaB